MGDPSFKRPRLNEPENVEYFKSYSDISIHEEMIADRIRTKTYRLAILRNYEKIHGKTVLDIGAGTGILSMFCVHAGAKKVYAIEASNMAIQTRKVIACNKMEDRITVIHAMVEDAELPEKVDVIVSEWMGYFLLYETMLPSVLIARDRWLREGGIMLPETATLYMAPFSDTEDTHARHHFWREDVLSQYKVDMSALLPYADWCVAGHVHVRQVLPEDVVAHAQSVCVLNLTTIRPEELSSLKSSFSFKCFGHAEVHGFAAWFKVTFPKNVELSTSPYDPPTHWEQSLVYLSRSIPVAQDTDLSGTVSLSQNARNRRFLDIAIDYCVDGGSSTKKEWKMDAFIT